MDQIKNQFQKELLDLKRLIAFYRSEIKLLGDFDFTMQNANNDVLKELSESLKNFNISKRQFNYNSIIISLYGSFERFIENMLVTYVDFMNHLIVKYDKLPDALVKNHYNLSLSLLNKIGQPRYTGTLKKEVVISNLHTCINLNENYQLNKDAFAQHAANFRLQVIDESFSHLGIQTVSNLIIKNKGFYDYVSAKTEKISGDSITVEESFYLLNDLAERRNDVAHGVSSEILQNEILSEYIDFFEYYSDALTAVLDEEYLRHELVHSGRALGEITNVFKEGKVICIFTNKIPIKKGDVLIGKNEAIIVKARVVGLQHDDKEMEQFDDKVNYEIGVELDEKFRKNFTVFLLSNS